MYNEVIRNAVTDKTRELIGDKSIVVLKGIPLSLLESQVDKVNLGDVVSDKLNYFMSVYMHRKAVSYEEFILMADFILSQYKTVYVLNNNIYMNQYPIEECFPEAVRVGLLNHFGDSDNEENDNCYIGDIDEYVSIFEGLKEQDGYLIGTYNKISAVDNPKIVTLDLFDNNLKKPDMCDISDGKIYDIVDESDYLSLVKVLFSNPSVLRVRTTNYIGDVNRLKNRISLLSFYWEKSTVFFFVQERTVSDSFQHRSEFTDILRKYWGYSSFRNLPVYDMAKLEQGEKKVVSVSQENIISNIVDQVEKCGERSSFRDIFVTAPTGAGKSVMFQIPAIYLAEKYNLLTIVISPLIGLMNDQVKNLEIKRYKHARTINSDISPIIKDDIISKVGEGEYDILYISPETLLSRSDVEQLIGDRTIGMIAIDEAHIVTTWGKQFRPDYWYLGDHIRKLRKQQIEKKGRSFVIATFTATAIYHGIEDMYTDTVNSLHMLNPITYLGYVKRSDIEIVIDNPKKSRGERSEYEFDKFQQIEELLMRSIITNKKTLVYFPTVALIKRCYEYLQSQKKVSHVAVYYGTLSKDRKQENYEQFYNKEKLFMLATKAFGMGIDIDDIEIVAHFAPTGNVCDYVQEIGRAARKEQLKGEAIYHYNSKDFKHINRLHGLSTIHEYQLIKVLEKIYDLYIHAIQTGKRDDYTKKRNAMLLDAENFAYIFGTPVSDEDDNVNKVKTALLLIQKDFESKVGFSPINVRPIPMFSVGFFEVSLEIQKKIHKRYHGAIQEINEERHICRVLLNVIWNKDYKNLSFPKFKYLLYGKSKELDFNSDYPMIPALCVNIKFEHEYNSNFRTMWEEIKGFVMEKVQSSEYTAISEMVEVLRKRCEINKYKAQTICEVIIASMDSYRKNFARTMSPIVQEKTMVDGRIKYQFNVAVNSYFKWIETGFNTIDRETKDGKLYLTNDIGNRMKEHTIILGVLEAMDILSFEMLGGANSQLYIYINQIQSIKNIINAPYRYNNRLLEKISERHLISVKMLTYFYEGSFTNEERWNMLEDYFLGVIPEKVKQECTNERPGMRFD